jgi:hypothetical protein
MPGRYVAAQGNWEYCCDNSSISHNRPRDSFTNVLKRCKRTIHLILVIVENYATISGRVVISVKPVALARH